MLSKPHFFPMGDQALIVEFGDRVDPALSAQIAAVAQLLRESRPIGVLDIVPAYSTLALHYDPAAVGAGASPYEALVETVGTWLKTLSVETLPAGHLIEIPVCYGGTFGEDLQALAQSHNLSVEEVIAIHSAASYHVHMLGFVPGFAYLGGLDERLATPRRATPRPHVPAGSVAIGGAQTGVYPLDTPGGWQIIGRTPLRLFKSDAVPPSLLNAGDTVRFVPISAQEFEAQSKATA
ncbi:MAG TPA: 5-oxoprolinase subunit PxpB [Burkholderiales bacterium]|nr:5-oxoprolinase subunit PxpB [Burkholderiales bacterium]